jgi:hypothetical protein
MVTSMNGLATSPSIERLVAGELDALPDWLLGALQSGPVVVSDEVRDTLRHEIAHHLGRDEGGVRALGF